MFEAVELGRRVTRKHYNEEAPGLRVDLINLQYELRHAEKPFPVILIVSGDDRPGFNETFDLLHEWMDARYLETHALGPATDEELERPEFWRYWRTLPARGKIGVYVGGWTLRAIRDRLGKRISQGEFERALERIAGFEKALADDGALVLKFWMHIGKDDHARRLRKARKDPGRSWRINEVDRRIYENYDRAIRTVERAIRKTSAPECPWHIVESHNARYRDLEVGRRIRDALTARLADGNASKSETPARPSPAPVSVLGGRQSILDTLDLGATIAKPEYEKQLEKLQGRVHRLADEAVKKRVSSVLVFEGWDAAGKGGCIRRLTAPMNPRFYRVYPIAAPTPEELAHHYLWRFWGRLPREGHLAVFDRSWFGRVLVERVEGYASEAEWVRAYEEINEFEEQLVERGILLLKFWLHIDRDEQMRRFQAREKTAFKKHKITEDDYRNRERWQDYELAVSDMVTRTSTEFAPWHLVPANSKRYARIEVLRTFCRALKTRLSDS